MTDTLEPFTNAMLHHPNVSQPQSLQEINSVPLLLLFYTQQATSHIKAARVNQPPS
jgi:hypothetical protein